MVPINVQLPDASRAAAVVYAIAEQSTGNTVRGKTRLFKAFYFAHLFYALDTGRRLTDWPIVHMPYGPAIHSFDLVCNSLGASIVTTNYLEGPYPAHAYGVIANVPAHVPQLDPCQLEAIRKAVEFIDGKYAAELSAITHDQSRSWQQTKNGERMAIYDDLLSDEEFSEQEALRKAVDGDQAILNDLLAQERESQSDLDQGAELVPFEGVWNAS